MYQPTKLRLPLLFFTLLLCNVISAQESKKFAHNALAEKIYLQLDNEVYTTNKTIWFKAVVLNAATHDPKLSSGTLYVEIVSSNKEVLDSKLIKITNGIGHGSFDLDSGYQQGKYVIRAYTQWNKNFNSDFLYEKSIQIFAESENVNRSQPVDNIRLIDTIRDRLQIRADLYPNLIDSRHSKKLEVYISDGITNDTLTVSKEGGVYSLETDVSSTASYIKLTMKTKNELLYSTSFSPDSDYIDLQFFPESGGLVDGLSSKVGFKALDINGRGKYVEGDILGENDEIIASFKSNALGMGHFVLQDPNAQIQYKAKVKLASGTYKTITLPKVITLGTVMSVSSRGNTLTVYVSSNYKNNKNVKLKASSRGYEYFSDEASLENGYHTFVIPKQDLPEGVIAFTLLNDKSIPMIERLFFNMKGDDRLMISAATNKAEYEQREQMTIDISSADKNGTPISTNTSVLVVDKGEFEDIQELRENILSYFLLSSDIRGQIESPGAYFKTDSDLNIDDLMLTQGWTKYKYLKPLSKLNYKKENGLNVSGVVNKRGNRAKKEELDLMLMTFGDDSSTYLNTSKVPGSFHFELNDMYGDNRDILIRGVNLSDKEKKSYPIAISTKKPLPVSEINLENRTVLIDSLSNKIVEKQRDHIYRENKYYTDIAGVTQLDEVYIEGYKMTPLRKEVNERYGSPDAVIDGKEIKEKENKNSFGLYSVLMAFHDKIRINRDSLGRLSAETNNGGKGHITLVVVDGKPVMELDYPLIQFIDVDEVLSFEVIDDARNIKKLFATVYSTVPPDGPLYGSVIAIYTRSKQGLYGALKSKEAIEVKNIPVYALEKEFYTPKHGDASSSDFRNPDLRLPLFWSPQVVTGANGKASVSYYNSDTTGEFLVILEGVTENGQMGYKELTYSVKNNPLND